MSDVLSTHRAFYDAVETGDVDLMSSLWVDDVHTSCVHPGAEPLRGTDAVLRSWTLLMANVGYIQFFLTDVEVNTMPPGAEEPDTAVVTCTENILSGEGVESVDAFSGGKAVCTSILVRDRSSGPWKFWSRHASPVIDIDPEAPEEP
ncbi:nuclear transport factor 2 family protein [Aeromicrobium terrae]|uniref:nuclear transport factor 2 family protein n=1 Tax=Aeromicrobium terrae TaxID=2498846 RepID=UPI001C9C4C88|nr:nuclear transport factor 2 family protein [Aeromicrobium terrae]